MTNTHIVSICSKLMQMFEDSTFPAAVARTVIARLDGDDKPCNNWSLCNQLIMSLSGTEDSRGFRQWQRVNRKVRAGAKAVYILAPITKKVNITNVDPQSGLAREEEQVCIKGFKAVPVFRYEDTEGDPLPEIDYTPTALPPLFHVAQHFGAVKYLPYQNRELGSCSSSGEIQLYSEDVDVFFHELAHLAHSTIQPLRGGQHVSQEIVAEMTACVLCELYGFPGYLWQGWNYMRAYAGGDPVSTLRTISSLLGEVEAVLQIILSLEFNIKDLAV